MKKKNNHKKLYMFLTIVVVLVAILCRLRYINVNAGDYEYFLQYWYGFFEMNGIKGLGFYPFDYAPLYVTFLAIFSYIPISHLIITKMFSYLFEILLAVLIYKYLSLINKKDNKYLNILLSSLILLAPTPIFNTGYWCQCDSIYTFFVVLALYLYSKGHINKSFISLGVAFSFKLQFIFVLPVFIILFFRDKKIKWYQFLYIPLMNLLFSIPSFIFGFSLKDLLNIYLTQTSEYASRLTWYVNNIYELVDFSFMGDYAIKIMSIITILIFVLLLLYCIGKKIKFDNKNILQLAILSILICNLFLPCMHERYLYMADLISIIYVLIYRRCYFQALLINFISMVSYAYFVFAFFSIPSRLVAVVFILVTINQFLIFRKYSLRR